MPGESESESLFMRQLWSLAGAVGEPESFVVNHEGVRVAVSYSSGSGSNVRFTAPYPRGAPGSIPAAAEGYRSPGARPLAAHRPLAIELRYENVDDRRAKAAGINREVQTGDAKFDRDVYIDSPAPDEVVAAVLRPAALRRGVRTLLELGFSRVLIDDAREEVAAPLNAFAENPARPDRAARALAAFADIVRALPAVERLPGNRPGDPWKGPVRALFLLVLAGLFVALPAAYLGLAPGRCIESTDDGFSLRAEWACWQPAALGLPLGLVVGAVLARVLSKATRAHYVGRSDSSKHMGNVGCLGLLAGLLVTLFAAVWWCFR